MPNVSGMSTANYMSGNISIYHEPGAINGEILNFNLKLLDRFKDSGIDPYGYAPSTVEHILKVIKGVDGLENYYKLAGSPNVKPQGQSSERRRGWTGGTPTVVYTYSGAHMNNYALASTLFHEFTHAIQDRFYGIPTWPAERQAYSTEWRLADRSLRVLDQQGFYSGIWKYMYFYQFPPVSPPPAYPY